MSKEAMKLALDALGEIEWSNNSQWQSDRAKVAITALREALVNEALNKKAENARELGLDYAPAQQDPFIYYRHYDGGTQDFPDEKTIPLYTSPPAQRTWVGLTDEERIMCRSYDPEEAVAKTEAKLKEKNT